ncbi:hypothetical protein [Actinophytocola sp.]|uniref:hypothetical protein n=1 Tax=Actinophytocola sp. TaxID=1872138 RepID=UPI00389AD043
MPNHGANATTVVTHAVLAVIIRVCGEVPTRVEVHELSSPPPQVHLYVADTMIVVEDVVAIGAVCRRWDLAAYGARRLPLHASQTWLQPHWTSAPVATVTRLTLTETFHVQMITARAETATPMHLRVTTGRLVWQVVDRTAFDRIGAALREAEDAFPVPRTF